MRVILFWLKLSWLAEVLRVVIFRVAQFVASLAEHTTMAAAPGVWVPSREIMLLLALILASTEAELEFDFML